MKNSSFPYSYWVKFLGAGIILLGVYSFLRQYLVKDIIDTNELAIGLSWGLLFIFFSKEKADDEMIHELKFRSLTRAVITAFVITLLYNYLVLNWRLKRDQDMILSISAYQFLALTMLMATALFYYYRSQAAINEPNEEHH